MLVLRSVLWRVILARKKKRKKLVNMLHSEYKFALKKYNKHLKTDGDFRKAVFYLAQAQAFSTAINLASSVVDDWDDVTSGGSDV